MTSEQGAEPSAATTAPDASTIIRDALVLQAKLVVDGLRDAILIPVSFFAALISIFLPGGGRRLLFYEVVRAGRRSERWINLFDAADRVYPDDTENDVAADLDDLLQQVESQLRNPNRADGTDRPEGESTESILDRIRAARRRFRPDGNAAEDQ